MRLSWLRVLVGEALGPPVRSGVTQFKSKISPNTLIKVMVDEGRVVFKVPGYCIRLGDYLEWAGGLESTLTLSGEVFYRVHFNTARLRPIPFPDEGIVGWRGGPSVFVPDAELVAREYLLGGVGVREGLVGRFGGGRDVVFRHNVIRSIFPGVFNSNLGVDGLEGEVVINVRCKLVRVDGVDLV